jgi:hypothetical protein
MGCLRIARARPTPANAAMPAALPMHTAPRRVSALSPCKEIRLVMATPSETMKLIQRYKYIRKVASSFPLRLENRVYRKQMLPRPAQFVWPGR